MISSIENKSVIMYKYKIVFWIITLFVVIALTACDKEVTTSPPDQVPAEGKIIVSSVPDNALIYLNGRNTGRFTPDSLTFLEDGIYNLTFKKKYFKDTSIVVTISDEESREIFLDYLSNPSMYGRMNLTSNPQSANIELNDSLLDITTPVILNNLLPGEYTVRMKLFNYRDVLINTIVQSNNLSSYSAILRDTSVWVDFQTFNSQIPSNLLTDIAIDNQGIKWIGSTDKGLIRFDGTNFTNYSTLNSGLASNIINSISISPDNKIWVGTVAGLSIFDGASWITYDMDNSGLTANQINSVEFDQAGIAWIGCSSGLFKFDGISWTRYNDQQSSLWVLDTKILNNKIWIGTIEKGIFSLEGETLIQYPEPIYLYPSIHITSVESDASGNIWFTHSPDVNLHSGVSYFDGSSFTSFAFGSINVAVNDVSVDQFNNKWISSFDGLLRYDNGNTSILYSTLNSLLSSNRVKSTAIDNNGVVWITTSGGGLNKFKSGSP